MKLALCSGLLPLLAGCGGDPFPYDKVSGTIRYEDGTPIPASRLVVTLLPQGEALDKKTHPRPGMVEVRPDGTFDTVTTHTYGDGAIRGKHKMTIIAYDEQELPLEVVPEEYARGETTPLLLNTADSPWTIAIKRPGEQ